MNNNLRKIILASTTLATLAIASVFVINTSAFAPGLSANGQGALGDRKFSFNARLLNAETSEASGHATLHNPAFQGENGNSPYMLQIDVLCMHRVGNVVYIGGNTRRTNDPTLVDAVFFAVQDNGEPGKGRDKISRAVFWDDDPSTTGDPMSCALIQAGDANFPLETITAGNVQVK